MYEKCISRRFYLDLRCLSCIWLSSCRDSARLSLFLATESSSLCIRVSICSSWDANCWSLFLSCWRFSSRFLSASSSVCCCRSSTSLSCFNLAVFVPASSFLHSFYRICSTIQGALTYLSKSHWLASYISLLNDGALTITKTFIYHMQCLASFHMIPETRLRTTVSTMQTKCCK